MSLREEWFIVIERHDMKKLCLWKTLNRSSTSGKECRTTQAKGGSITKSHTPETHQYLEEVPVLGGKHSRRALECFWVPQALGRKHFGQCPGALLVLSWFLGDFLVVSWVSRWSLAGLLVVS